MFIGRKELVFSFILFFITAPILVFGEQNNFLKAGDEYFSQRNKVIQPSKSLKLVEKALENYKKALKSGENIDVVLFKYARGLNFKNNYLPVNISESKKIKEYKFAIDLLEKEYKKHPESKYINYSLALLWGRYGELIGVLNAARKGVAGKIKKYAENLYRIDKGFNGYSAGLILGRLHYKTPSIPFLLSWPDLKKSKKFLQEVLEKGTEDSVNWAKFFLADTLYKLGETKKAGELYNDLLNMKINKSLYFEELKLKKDCRKRMQELNIK